MLRATHCEIFKRNEFACLDINRYRPFNDPWFMLIIVTRHDISRLMEVKRHKEKNVVKVPRCETGHLSHRQLLFLLQYLS